MNPALIRLRGPLVRFPELVRNLPARTQINLAFQQVRHYHRWDYALGVGDARRRFKVLQDLGLYAGVGF